MSGGGKKVTVGYWYRMLFGYGWCKGPIDAFLEMRGGGRTAWKGLVTQTSRIYVNALNLWGGEKREGGLQGYFDVQLGEADQGVNDYLQTRLGRDQPTYRGKAIGVWRGGRYGAMNPYPKRLEFKVRRILRGWDGDQPWYPEKAEIVILDGSIALLGRGWEYQVETFSEPNTVWDNFTPPTSGWQMGGDMPFTTNGMSGGKYWTPTRSNIWLRRQIRVNASGVTMHIAADNGCVVWVNGINVGSSNPTNAPISNNQNNPVSHQFTATGTVEVLVKAFAEVSITSEAGNLVTLAFTGPPLYGMNPAHILYDSLTASDMQGEPVGMINEVSFIAAADQLFQEGFGLCTTYDPDAETVEEFQQRICSVIGASLTQSRINGQYYLDLIRDDDTEGLPIITADDIIELKWEPVPLTELVNQITVEWFDPERKEHRSTPPVQSLGAIRAAGRVIPEVMRYPEIPSETLALRVAARDLQARSTPLTRFTLTTNRRRGIWALRPGQRFRLQSPQDGFADIVCVLGDIDVGTLTSGRITIKAVQDVFGMPDTVYVEAEAGQAPPQNLPPAASPHQRLIEAPYVELVTNMSSSELAVFPEDAGVVMAMASQPLSGLNYSLWSGPEGTELEDNGSGDWCPVARVAEEADYLDTVLTLTSGSNLEDVVVGSWALWDEEIVRVDAIDPVTLTVTLGRGCADTVPHKHDANSLIYFCGDWGATDDVQYVDGETVTAKLLTRTSSAEQSIEEAAELAVEMSQRQQRPYPPAGVKVNSQDYPEEVFGDIVLSWAHRDRLMQSDKLIDACMPSVGPEPGTSYVAELYSAFGSVPLLVESGITGDTAPPLSPPGDGSYRIELYSERDGLPSWQRYSHVVNIGDGPPPDPHWNKVVVLLRFDGDFNDETGRVWTQTGEFLTSTESKVFGTASAYFPPSGLRGLITPSTPDLNLGGEDFTVECWINPRIRSRQLNICGLYGYSYNRRSWDLLYETSSGGRLFFRMTSNGRAPASILVSASMPSAMLNKWTHVAVTRDGNTFRMFFDGELVDHSTSSIVSFENLTDPFVFGTSGPDIVNSWDGYIDELRITKGLARYTEYFPPPVGPFPGGGH